MIRWCSFCQRLLGELAPFDDPRFTHGLCEACDARLERDEPLKKQTEPLGALMARVLAAARDNDEHACSPLLAEAAALGLTTESVLVGLLQPALYQAGLDWQETRMSVAAEHRFTSWCERVFNLLPPPEHRGPPIDLLIIQPPGNSHTVGPRFAASILSARGLAVEVCVPSIPFEEMVALAKQHRPRCLGFSCALPSTVPVAADLMGRLRERLEPSLGARYVVSGFAFRLGGGELPATVGGAEVVIDLESFMASLTP